MSLHIIKNIIVTLIGYSLSVLNVYAKDFTLVTEDGFKLAATILEPDNSEGAHPAVILIHQGGSNRGEWAFSHDDLLKAGYTILSYDIRGMGASPSDNGMGKVVENIYNAPDQAPNDLKAAIAYLEAMDNVDNNHIGIVGASVGGNLAIVGAATMNIRTAVAMSAKTEAVLNLAGNPDIKFNSTFYISSMESNGERAEWAQEMFKQKQPGFRKLKIILNSKAHGVSIFKDAPELKGEILEWLRGTLDIIE